MPSDFFVDNPMTFNYERYKPQKRIDHKKITAYEKAIDILDAAAEKICFPGADDCRAEIYKVQRQMQRKIWRLEDGTDD